MKLVRAFAWLLTVVAFMMPAATIQPASAMPGHEMTVGCHDHMPPPPCPDHDTAKHAAGTCCPSMAAALLPARVAAQQSAQSSMDRTSTPVAGLMGFSRAKEPPPPRS
jgi:hypothetical protein